jgi:hypothetical protein
MSDPTPEHRHHGPTPWLGGTILIVLGLIFLLRNLGIVDIARWWALVFLIPAVVFFNEAWRQRQQAGAFTGRATGSIVAGIIFVGLTAAFLFGLDWGVYWPVILILVGVAALSGVYWRRG